MIDEDFDLEEDLNEEVLSEEELLLKIDTFHSHKLCDIVIANRYLGMFKNIHKECMSELGKRRANGDSFNFEEYIDKNLEEMPKIQFKVSDISSVLNNIKF